jgi:transcription termination/antitermination protein NusG
VGITLASAKSPWAREQSTASEANPVREAWFAVCTVPRRERFVHGWLMAKHIESFLPVYATERQSRNRVRREIQHPLWPGYLFVRIGRDQRIPVLHTPGVRHIVGAGSSPLPLDEQEMHALGICSQCAWLLPHPFRCVDNTVRIAHGPLQGLKGYARMDACDLLFVVNIQVIQRSFAIRLQPSDLEFEG